MEPTKPPVPAQAVKVEAAAPKPESTLDVAKAFSKEMVTELLPALIVALRPKEKEVKEVKNPCGTCRQPFMACGGKHKQMNVLPSINVEWFSGLKLNGITYYGRCTVPELNDFAHQLWAWDDTEKYLQQKRRRMRYLGSTGAPRQEVAIDPRGDQ